MKTLPRTPMKLRQLVVAAVWIGSAFAIGFSTFVAGSVRAQEAPTQVEAPRAGAAEIVVSTDAELAAAVRGLSAGSRIVLASGRVFGPVQIPDGTKQLTISSDGTSTITSQLGTTTAVERPALSIGLRCSDIRLERLHFLSTNERTDAIQYTLVRCGYTADNAREATAVDDLPARIEFDRCRFTGTANGNTRIGLLGNARHLTVRGCVFREIHEVREDSQGILINNSPGPILIEKCDIEAAGENILLGGSVPKIKGLQLGDLTCVDNRLSKPLAWKGGPWACKNLFELKGCTRAYVARNRMSNNWPANQDGTAVLFTVRDGSKLSDIVFEANVVENTGSGLLLTAADSIDGTTDANLTGLVVLRRNLWLVGYHEKAGGRVFNVNTHDGRPVAELVIDGDRWFHAGAAKNSCLLFEGKPKGVAKLRISNCVGTLGQYGVIGANMAPGSASLEAFATTAELTGNVFIGGKAAAYGRFAEQNFFVE